MGMTDLGTSHIRAGRCLLGWRQGQLATAANVSRDTVTAIEDDIIECFADALALCHALAGGGIAFLVTPEMIGVGRAYPIGGLGPTRVASIAIEHRQLIEAACGLFKCSHRRLIGRAGVKASLVRDAWARQKPLPQDARDALEGTLSAAGVVLHRSIVTGARFGVEIARSALVQERRSPPWRREPRGWE